MVGVDFTEKLTFEERFEAWKEFIARIYKRVFQVAAIASAKALRQEQRPKGRGMTEARGGKRWDPAQVRSSGTVYIV